MAVDLFYLGFLRFLYGYFIHFFFFFEILYVRHVLHKYANEDVSVGSWFIGLDVEHVDDRRLCCGTPPGKFKTL